MILNSFWLIPLGLVALAYFRYAPREGGLANLFYDLGFGLVAISIPIYFVSLVRRNDLIAAIAPEGITLTRTGPGRAPAVLKCSWSELKAIEILRVRKGWRLFAREHVFIRLRNDTEFADFPLNRMSKNLFHQFVDALHQHWPDLESPREVQLANRKHLDSSER